MRVRRLHQSRSSAFAATSASGCSPRASSATTPALVITNLVQQDSVAVRSDDASRVRHRQPGHHHAASGSHLWRGYTALAVRCDPSRWRYAAYRIATQRSAVTAVSVRRQLQRRGPAGRTGRRRTSKGAESHQAQAAYAEQVEAEAREGLKTAAARRQSRAPSRPQQGRSSKE